jgi:hypothetical protein
MCLVRYILGLYVSRANLTLPPVLSSTMMWRQALLYRRYAAHARREPTHLEQVGPPSVEEEKSEDDKAAIVVCWWVQ